MNNEAITRLCVGEPFTVTFGVPMKRRALKNLQRQATRISEIADADDSSLADELLAESEVTLDRPSRMTIRLPFLIGLAMACAGAIGVNFYSPLTKVHVVAARPGVNSLPIEPHKAITTTAVASDVAVVDSAYETPISSDQSALVASPVVVPVAAIPSIHESDLLSRVKDMQMPPERPATVQKGAMVVVRSSKASTTVEKDMSAALVMDDETRHESDEMQPPKREVVPTEASATPVKQVVSRLVAIAPDGKYALFTNPKNRMPEKVLLGATLPNGEVVKAIDKGLGKVETDKNQYTLD